LTALQKTIIYRLTSRKSKVGKTTVNKSKTIRVYIHKNLSKVFEGLFCYRSKIFSTFAE